MIFSVVCVEPEVTTSSPSSNQLQDEILIVPKPSLVPVSRVILSQNSGQNSNLDLQLNRQQNLIDSIFPEKRFECKTTVFLNDSHGFVKTPDYSNTLPLNCRWIIHGRRNDSRIVLNFEKLHLVNDPDCNQTTSGSSTISVPAASAVAAAAAAGATATAASSSAPLSSQSCCKNYLKVTSKSREEKFCSTSKSFVLFADQNVTIDFHSELSSTTNNFYLSYEIFPKETPKCHCQCANGECLSHETQICNRRTECSDGSDEAFCLGHKFKRSKLIFEMCRIPSKRLRNLSHLLLPGTVILTSDCNGDRFHCRNGPQCIPRSSVCDGVIDCADHSDETNCTQFQCPGIVCDQTRCVSNERSVFVLFLSYLPKIFTIFFFKIFFFFFSLWDCFSKSFFL